MRELTQVFNDTLLNVESINEKEFMIDVSGIAKSHGKNITNWKESKRMKETLTKLEELGFSNSTLIKTEHGSGTMIHSKLLINFARFISVDFEMWCDEFILNYLTKSNKAKDIEIARLKAEKKLCMVTEDGYSSARGIAQRSRFSEHQVKTLAKDLGLVKQEIKDILFWRVIDEKKGLVRPDINKTPYYDVERFTDLLDQAYPEEM